MFAFFKDSTMDFLWAFGFVKVDISQELFNTTDLYCGDRDLDLLVAECLRTLLTPCISNKRPFVPFGFFISRI